MKILLLNGSSHPQGCTYTALREVANVLEDGGAEAGTGESGPAEAGELPDETPGSTEDVPATPPAEEKPPEDGTPEKGGEAK